MRQLLSCLLIVPTVSVVGCAANSDWPDASDPKNVTVHWTVKTVDGAVAPCPTGFTTLLFYSQPILPDFSLGSAEPVIQTVDCASGSGTTVLKLFTSGFTTTGDMQDMHAEYSPKYSINLEVTEPTMAIARATGLSDVDLSSGDASLDLEVYPDAGFLIENWELYSGVGGNFVDQCATVGVDMIEHRYQPFGSDPSAPFTVDQWPCEHTDPNVTFFGTYTIGNGRSRPLPPGDYVGTLAAMSNGVEAANAPTAFNIKTGNGYTEDFGDTLTIANH